MDSMRPRCGGQVLAEVGVAATQEVARSHHGEGHGVLIPVGDPGGLFVVRDVEESEVGGDVEGVVGGIDAEPVDVADLCGVGGGDLGRGFVAAPGRQKGRGEREGRGGEGGSVHGVDSGVRGVGQARAGAPARHRDDVRA
ncbi:hypothetical protein [Nocardioides sp. TF02-7]|uniref:hypothetical protein n=1 Tax=Nocardioides sp. TF02-7 TaxID=2917724 RepID=UPI001F05BAC6|nr:hypothetical protein [Nocardioides sp. TF02-7]UMG92193.1 hypothetical protein MF408_20115 [Nocardioides sp. TF02-7]